MKSLGCYKNYRAFYEVRPNERIKVKGVGYLDGYAFEKAFEFEAVEEKEATYAFREKVDNLHYSKTNPYPDLTRNPYGNPTFNMVPLPKE